MPHPVLGLSFASRDVYLSPSRLSRESELIGELYSLVEPHLDVLAEDIEDDLADAIEAVRTIAGGGRADADTAHELLTDLAEELEESGDYDDAITARIVWLVAAWLSVKMGRHLRTEAGSDPLWRFGGLVNVLALPRLGGDFRELLAAIDESLSKMDETVALDRLFRAMEPLLELVDAAELRRFAAGGDIDVGAVHNRLESLALAADEEVDMESHRLSSAAWVLAVWLRMRSGDSFGYTPNFRDHYPPMTLRWLTDRLVWTRAAEPSAESATVSWHPESEDLFAGLKEALEVHRLVTGAGFHDAHRPEVSGDHYDRALDAVVSQLSKLDPARRLDVLYAWISPLLDEVAWENREFMDEPEMTTAEAVERFRLLATGETPDDGDEADAVHYHLSCFALGESEDQDPEMHVRSQAAFLATDWLRLKTGRKLRADEQLGDYAPDDLPGLVNTLAWTRSRQISHLPEYVDELIEDGHDLLTPITELRAMRSELVEARAAPS